MRLVPKSPFDGTFVALDESGQPEAEGHLDVDIIPQGPGTHIVSGVRFVTHPVPGEPETQQDQIMRALGGGV